MMKTTAFTIDGMHCNGCAALIQGLLQRTAGVQKASASSEDGQARVLYDPGAVTAEQLTAVIEKGGYRVTGRDDT